MHKPTHTFMQAKAIIFTRLAVFLLAAFCVLPAFAQSRVISLAPHITELIFAAGASEQIVATVTSSNYPFAAQEIPRVGDGVNVSLERILKFKPNIVYAWQNTLAIKKISPKLKAMNIEVVFVAPQNIHEIPTEIIKIGRQLGTEKEATLNAEELTTTLSNLKQQYINKKLVSVFVEIGVKPVYTLGNDPITNSTLKLCGGKNVFANSDIVAPTVSAESVIHAAPEAIIVANKSIKHLDERTRHWSSLGLESAKNKNIYAIDPDTLLRPGPRLIEAAVELCGHLSHVH